MKKILLSALLAFVALASQSGYSQTTEYLGFQTATNSKYYAYYQAYTNTQCWVNISSVTNYWLRQVTNVSCGTNPGLGLFDNAATGGAGVASESQGYAMINAALYNDKNRFDRLSALVQALIPWGSTGGGSPVYTKLYPWLIHPTNGIYMIDNSGMNGYNSASDGDINIALAYIYADQASSIYGWSSYPEGSSSTYADLAAAYIKNIRLHDFVTSSSASVANQHILMDGATQATYWALGSKDNWHPDYSDLRAYQLFQMYDTDTTFWSDSVTYTKAAFKALFYFGGCGSVDSRTVYADSAIAAGTNLACSNNYTLLGNALFQGWNINFSSDYRQVSSIQRADDYDGGTNYSADACRMPIRLMNYVNSQQNTNDSDIKGIANSALTALGASFSNSSYSSLYSLIGILSPYSQGGTYLQDFIACGLLDYAGNTNLPYAAGNTNIFSKLNAAFGTNPTTGCASNDFSSANNVGFNPSITLWALSESVGGEPPLQLAVQSLGVSTDFTYIYTSPTEITLTSYTGNDITDIDIPSTINGATVTRIADWAFWGTKVKVVYLPTTLKSIDFFAFAWSNVKEVYYSGDRPQVFGAPFSLKGLTQPKAYFNATKTGWLGGRSGLLGGSTPYIELAPGSTVPTIQLWSGYSTPTFKATGLPKGITLNNKSARLSGSLAATGIAAPKPGVYNVTIIETDGRSKVHPAFKLRIIINKTMPKLLSHQQALGVTNPNSGTIYLYPEK